MTDTKKFQQRRLDFDNVDATTSPKGGRVYHTESGDFPSVTTWLKNIVDQTGIEKWKKRVGEEAAVHLAATAGSRGSAVHFLVEQYLGNETLPDMMPNERELFEKVRPVLNDLVDEVYGIEFAVWHDELQLAGRVDQFVQLQGEDMVLDLKTGRENKPEAWLQGYYYQAALYSFMLSCMMVKRAAWSPDSCLKRFAILYVSDEYRPKVIIRPVAKYLQKLSKATGEEAHYNEIFFGSNSPYGNIAHCDWRSWGRG